MVCTGQCSGVVECAGDDLCFGPAREIYSQFSRCSTARGSSTGLVTVGHTKGRLVSLFYSLKVPLNSK